MRSVQRAVEIWRNCLQHKNCTQCCLHTPAHLDRAEAVLLWRVERNAGVCQFSQGNVHTLIAGVQFPAQRADVCGFGLWQRAHGVSEEGRPLSSLSLRAAHCTLQRTPVFFPSLENWVLACLGYCQHVQMSRVVKTWALAMLNCMTPSQYRSRPVRQSSSEISNCTCWKITSDTKDQQFLLNSWAEIMEMEKVITTLRRDWSENCVLQQEIQ